MEKGKKYVEVNEVGNGFFLRLYVGDDDGDRLVKEAVVVSDLVGDEHTAKNLGGKIIDLLATRIRNRKKNEPVVGS